MPSGFTAEPVAVLDGSQPSEINGNRRTDVEGVTAGLSDDDRYERIGAELLASERARVEEHEVSIARHEALVVMQAERLRLMTEDDRQRRLILDLERRAAELAGDLAGRDRTVTRLESELANALAAREDAVRRSATLDRDADELRTAIRYIRSRSLERDRIAAVEDRSLL